MAGSVKVKRKEDGLFPMYSFFGAHYFSLPKKECTYERIVFARPLASPQASLLWAADAFRVKWSEKVFQLSPGRSSRILHWNALTEKAWKNVVHELGKPVLTYPFLWFAVPSLRLAAPSPRGPATRKLSFTHLLRRCPWVISWTLTLWFIISYHR